MNLTKFKPALTAVAFLMMGTMASARIKHPANGEPPAASKPKVLEYIENKGQWVTEAKYRADIQGGAMFITDKGFVYNYSSFEDLERIHELTESGKDNANEIVHTHAYKVNFVGCNNNVVYKKEDKSVAYNNYIIGNDPSKWASNVGKFAKVSVNNIYNGVDLMVYSKNLSPKYDFISKVGTDPSIIKLAFEGVTPTIDAEGNLVIKTSVNEIKEQAPYVYQIIDGKEIKVASKYTLDKSGNIGFSFPEGFNKSYNLIIDPILVFATYSGGAAGGSGYYSLSSTYDDLGNMFAGSQAYNIGWPTTVGAFQSTFAGSQDVAINKYSATGSTLIFSTYYGGNGVDLPHTMMANNNGEIIVAGSTTSSNLPTTTTAYDNTSNGTDIFIAHFNVTGSTLIGATYIGGSSQEPFVHTLTGSNTSLINQNTTSPVELLTEANGDIWLVASTSSTDFPVTTGANQTTYGGGNTDGVVLKVNSTCSQLLYSSFLGGTGQDGVVSIQRTSTGNMVLGGITTSTDFPTTTGALHTTFVGGTTDGFVTTINHTTGAIVKSTYIGTNDNDNVVSVQVDGNDNIYVLGVTAGSYPISTGVYNVSTGNTFVDKLNPTLSTSLLSTRLGQSGYFPTAFLLDICENIYVCGLNANAGMPTTADAFLTAATGKFWFGVLEPNFSGLLYGSYFGTSSDHTHVGVNRLDPMGIVYHSICNSQQYPYTQPPYTPAGAYAPIKLNTGQDIVSFKFNFEATGVISNFVLDPAVSGNDTGCAPYTVHFLNNSTQAEQFTWDFGDGSPTTNVNAPTHVFTTPGVYTISLHANNPESCITDDTAFMTITVLQTDPPDFVVNDTILCTFEQNIPIGLTLNNPTPNNTIQWGPAAGIVGPNNTANIIVDPTISNAYYVTVKDTIPGICGFSETDTVHIDLRPRVLDIINNDTVVCEGAVLPITAVGTDGYVYTWSPSTGVSDTSILSPNITINQPNLYTLNGHYPGCPDTSVFINIAMHFMPHLTVSEDKFVCQWTDVALESNVSPFRNDYTYAWTPATSNLTNPTGPNTHFIADSTITYHLHVETPIGCADDDSVAVTVYPGGFGGIVSDTGYCPGLGAFANLWASGGATYQWTPADDLSDATAAAPIATPRTSTDYTVLITDIHNCTDTEKVTVQVYPAAQLTIPDSINIYPGESYHIEPNTNCSYFAWFPPSGLNSPNISDPTMSPSVRTRYFATATTENGCVIVDSIDVLVQETVLDMPNAFKPNGSNNLFKPAKRGIAKLNSFTIFNRWGNKVYTSTNPDNGWDGTFNDKAQPVGVYIYVIDAISDSGKAFTKQGTVTLIR